MSNGNYQASHACRQWPCAASLKIEGLSAAIATLIIGAAIPFGTAHAFEVENDGDFRIRWDNTIKYTAAWRIRDADPKIANQRGAQPGTDFGDLGIKKGLINNRFDILSELDVAYEDVGFRVSGAGWYSAYSTLQKVDVLEWELQQLQGVSATNSLAAFSRRATVGMNEGSFAWFDVPRSQGMINAVLMRTPRELYSQACDMLSVYIYLEDHKAETLQRVVAKIEDFALRNDTETVKFIQAAGNSGIEAATNIVVRQANGRMLLLVYAAVVGLAFVTFGSWRAVVCAILPLLLTSMLCEALMVALGIGVKVATLPVIALGVGIGIDYALYVLTVTMARLRQGMSLSEAYYHALLFTGKVVVLTGVTLGLAVATWGFSPIKFQADMGILLAFMFVVNMVGALILLPALARFLLPATALVKKSSKLSPAS
ncbi:DUF1302 family protein [Pseudomonas sp. 11/12A]|uniref:efflux RND transporter permease subunit n=1 Tax=Pseudomonas sp. 11/12A TaxID=1506582 RepID=UPI0009DCD88C